MDLANPQIEDIDFADIAARLSKLARFNGVPRGQAYSVAQHCVLGADALFHTTGRAEIAGYFLLHDAHEAYIGDIVRPTIDAIERELLADLQHVDQPLKRPLKDAVERVKKKLDIVIFAAAGVPVIWQLSDVHRQIKEMDEAMLHWEAVQLFGPLAADHLPPAPDGRRIGVKPWGACKAEEAWLERAADYLGISARMT
jgi:5'-deoxynucleotidase YfbR-like HD superfamily hydrolase